MQYMIYDIQLAWYHAASHQLHYDPKVDNNLKVSKQTYYDDEHYHQIFYQFYAIAISFPCLS
mgnify:CR=1 FL=1